MKALYPIALFLLVACGKPKEIETNTLSSSEIDSQGLNLFSSAIPFDSAHFNFYRNQNIGAFHAKTNNGVFTPVAAGNTQSFTLLDGSDGVNTTQGLAMMYKKPIKGSFQMSFSYVGASTPVASSADFGFAITFARKANPYTQKLPSLGGTARGAGEYSWQNFARYGTAFDVSSRNGKKANGVSAFDGSGFTVTFRLPRTTNLSPNEDRVGSWTSVSLISNSKIELWGNGCANLGPLGCKPTAIGDVAKQAKLVHQVKLIYVADANDPTLVVTVDGNTVVGSTSGNRIQNGSVLHLKEYMGKMKTDARGNAKYMPYHVMGEYVGISAASLNDKGTLTIKNLTITQ